MGKIVRRVIKRRDKLTAEQLKMLEEAEKAEPVFDDDCPYFTAEELDEMARITEERRKERKKEVVTLRISAAALKKAKATGKGYTGFLGRLIENALNDQDLVKRSL